MTLARLFFAWVPVAAVFVVAGGLGTGFSRLDATLASDEWRKVALWRSLEAGVVTLFASLWFDSLGHGGWWILFSLLGLIVALARLPDPTPSTLRASLVRAARDMIRYVLAGAILAWRLS